MLPLGDQLGQLGLKSLDIMLNARTPYQTKLPVECMKPEIGQCRQGKGWYDKVAQERLFALASLCRHLLDLNADTTVVTW